MGATPAQSEREPDPESRVSLSLASAAEGPSDAPASCAQQLTVTSFDG